MSLTNSDLTSRGVETKSEKIRALARKGVPTAEIARQLEIRYQHARNVLLASGQHKGRSEVESKASAERHRPLTVLVGHCGWAELTAEGAVTIPAALIAKAGFNLGTEIFVRVNADGIELLTKEAADRRAKRIAERFRQPGRSEVDEFIADKRAEAAAEDENWKMLK
jgi:antitoxin component of MazEF toxin-antitoxin module